jgi:hypothetical protein
MSLMCGIVLVVSYALFGIQRTVCGVLVERGVREGELCTRVCM